MRDNAFEYRNDMETSFILITCFFSIVHITLLIISIFVVMNLFDEKKSKMNRMKEMKGVYERLTKLENEIKEIK